MIDPRKTFAGRQDAKRWVDVIDGEQFQSAACAAMFAMQQQLQGAPDMGNAAAYHWQMEGALRFLSILMNLTVAKPLTPPPSKANLDHRYTV